ncbi:hypothetical protein NADFUDRAFT_44593, partial [Nadsonia fulvescens var. elongata DSM 6958]
MVKLNLTSEHKETLDRLKAAVWYKVGKIVEQECLELKTDATPQFIAALTELLFNQIINLGEDLESFSRHAKRKVITTDDLRMVCRRNEGLREVLDDFIEKLEQEKLLKRKNNI